MKFFSKKRKIKFNQKVAFVLALIILSEAVLPTVSFALTSGPAQPEFSSFEPVGTTSMVNEFTGDFTYNIPVLDIPGANGGGYAMSLSYHSGEGVESEASWVGSGWTLNPGAIMRGKRGFADDTKNSLTYFNDVPKNWTVSTGVSVGNLEVFSFAVPLSANASLRYNNYRGFGYTAGAGLSFQQGLVSLGYSISDGSGSFSAQVNPAALLGQFSASAKKEKKAQDAIRKAKNPKEKDEAVAAYKDLHKDDKKQTNGQKVGNKALSSMKGYSAKYGMYAFSDQSQATSVTPYDGLSFNTNFNIEVAAPPAELGPQIGFFGNYNQQKNVANINRVGYGYLYSFDAYGDDVGAMDYYVEKEGMYTKRDYFLSIPFSNADNFSVTGEGIAGGFRLHSNTAGHFRPTSATSKTGIFQLTGDIIVGLFYGGGVGLGLGQQTLKVNGDAWDNGGVGTTTNFRFPAYSSGGVTENYFFRFNGDLGGDVDFDVTNEVTKASLDVYSDFPGFKNYTPNLDLTTGRNRYLTSNIDMESGSVNRSGRSSYIGYHKNSEISGAALTEAYAYEKSGDYAVDAALAPVSVNRPGEQIGEIATINDDGNSYVYGLPVVIGKEKSLQYDLQGVSGADIHKNFVAYKDVDGTNKMKIGQVDNGTYYGTYLLTQITTPDYVDRTMNGPTVDDFGGYTKFQYEQVHKVNSDGTNGFHFRSPYTGLNYSKGEVSDKMDDMGAFSSGNKDIYLLKQVVTNTHTAKFYTSDRLDGVEAASDAVADGTSTAKGTKALKKLDRIELWTNGASPKLVKKVIFKYDYSTCKSLPNSNGTGSQTGKLTLKELWFEYDGIVSAKISPYKFDYIYPTIAGGVDYPTKYDHIQSEYVPFASSQNPDYSKFAIDAWGNYQDATTGEARFDLLKTNVNQTPPSDFDPAAWQLKQITLPSGGQIHVQYEQDEYLYVQDKRAEALVSLSPGQDDEEIGSLSSRYYKLNTADIGVTSVADKNALVALIKERYNGKKISFKFLYALMGLNPALDKCNSDYISGYVNFMDADIDAGSGDVRIRVGNSTDTGYDIPRRICLDLVQKQKGGKLNPLGNCDTDESGVEDGLGIKDMVMQMISKIGTSFFTNTSCCLELNSSLSYFKIPCLKAKKGGGVRVKRIMMYDSNGIDTNEEALYGTEYFYQAMDGTTSGVATNEPASLKDENALITFLPERRDQTFAEKAISGVDRDQFEGPVGESLLPAASIGYSRVVAKSIHSGKTNTGFVISEFNTVRDFPFGMQYNGGADSGVDYSDMEREKDWMNLPAIVLNYRVTNAWASQGFRFMLNSMHGQPRSVKTYSGDYTSGVSGSLSTYTQSSSTEYEYYKPGENIDVKKADGSIVSTKPGKEMEVVYEMKQVEDVTIDGSIEIDFGAGLAGIIPLPQASLSPMVNYTESKLRTHVTSKVINYPVIQKSVTTSQDGIVHKTENLVFSAYTGKPIVTKTTDGYNGLNLPSDNPHDGTYTAYTIPAYSQYSELGQKAATERVILTGSLLTGVTYKTTPYSALVFPIAGGCDALKLFTKGDLIRINSYYFHVDDIIGNEIVVKLTANLNTSASIGSVTIVEIVRSGKTNQLNSVAGSYITYGASSPTAASISPTAAQLSFITNLNTAFAGLASASISTFEFSICLYNTTGGSIRLTKNTGPPVTVSISVFGEPNCTNPNTIPYSSTGEFYIDNVTGQIKYRTSPTACFSYTLLPCIQFCSMNNTPATVTKVVASSAVTYDQIWNYDATKYASIPVLAYNDYETGMKGKWRPFSSFVYNVPVIGGATGTERNYKDAGTYTLEMFNWKNTSFNSTKWLKANTVTMYSPNGIALEEKDPLDIYSAAKFGYNNIVPYIVVQNSAYNFCGYESFENIYSSNTKFEDGVTANFSQYNNTPATPIAHSGTGSYTLAAAGANDFKLNKFTVNSSLQTSGLGIKVWVKDASRNPLPIKGNLIATTPGITLPFNFTKVAQTGEWTLYEAKINALILNTEYQFQLLSNLSSGTIYVDDVRQQPLAAQMNTFVYEPKTMRLIASFDDQHFGLFYQYNQQGKLVRKMVETEKGMKTITETQYSTPATIRTPGLLGAEY